MRIPRIDVTRENLARLLEDLKDLPAEPESEHLSDEQFAGYATRSLLPEEHRRAHVHLASCPRCLAQVEQLLEVAAEAEMPNSADPRGSRPRYSERIAALLGYSSRPLGLGFFGQLQAAPIAAVALAVGCMLTVLGGTLTLVGVRRPPSTGSRQLSSAYSVAIALPISRSSLEAKFDVIGLTRDPIKDDQVVILMRAQAESRPSWIVAEIVPVQRSGLWSASVTLRDQSELLQILAIRTADPRRFPIGEQIPEQQARAAARPGGASDVVTVQVSPHELQSRVRPARRDVVTG